MVQSSRKANTGEWVSFTIVVIGLVAVGAIVILLTRLQRGMIGVVLAIVATLLLIYWLREFRKTVAKDLGLPSPPPKKEMMLDIIKGSGGVTVVAEVPGPEDQVKVDLKGQTLDIVGGMKFKKAVNIDGHAKIDTVTYLNGVLTVRLKKPDDN